MNQLPDVIVDDFLAAFTDEASPSCATMAVVRRNRATSCPGRGTAWIDGFTNRTVSWTHGIGWVSAKPGRDGNFKVRGLVRTGWYSETSGGKGGKVLQEATGSTTTVGSRTRSFWTTKDKATGEQRSFRSSEPKSNKH